MSLSILKAVEQGIILACDFAFIENLLLYEDVLETHFRTLIELARLLEDTGLRLITNHEDEEEEED